MSYHIRDISTKSYLVKLDLKHPEGIWGNETRAEHYNKPEAKEINEYFNQRSQKHLRNNRSHIVKDIDVGLETE